MSEAVTSINAIETGDFAAWRWVLCPPSTIRVICWNINRGLQLPRIVDFLAEAKPDVILLQESDLNARRTHHLNIARKISQDLQLNYVFGREFQELTQGSRASPAYHGQATLSRWPLSNSRIIRFQRQSNFWRPHWFLPEIDPFQERLGGRIALVSDANIAGKMVTTYNLHLESRGADGLRCAQLGEALADARRCDPNAPIVFAGDFNLDASGGPAASAIDSCAISGCIRESARTDNSALVFRAGAHHRLDFYSRTGSRRRAPGSSLDIGFRPLSSLRHLGFCLARPLPCLAQKCARPQGHLFS